MVRSYASARRPDPLMPEWCGVQGDSGAATEQGGARSRAQALLILSAEMLAARSALSEDGTEKIVHLSEAGPFGQH